MSNKPKPEEQEDRKTSILRRRAEYLAKPAAQREEEERRWKAENAEAFRSMNEWVEQHGMPLEKYRLF